jgi:hypothetical protein
MKRILKIILKLALVALLIIQFIRPDKNQEGYESVEAFELETKPSEQVATILQTNCYDCHSNETHYPWYAEISPVNYWLEDHIKHGKGHFNVSAWSEYSVKKKDHKLEELIEMVEEGIMPLDSYTWLHGDLSKEDTNALLQWATMVRLGYVQELKVSAN